jgi:hypothetical protein
LMDSDTFFSFFPPVTLSPSSAFISLLPSIPSWHPSSPFTLLSVDPSSYDSLLAMCFTFVCSSSAIYLSERNYLLATISLSPETDLPPYHLPIVPVNEMEMLPPPTQDSTAEDGSCGSDTEKVDLQETEPEAVARKGTKRTPRKDPKQRLRKRKK